MPWSTAAQGTTFAPGWSWFGGATPPDDTADIGGAVFELVLPSMHHFVDIVVIGRRTTDDQPAHHLVISNTEVWGGLGSEIGPYTDEIMAEVLIVDHADSSIVYFDWVHERYFMVDLSGSMVANTSTTVSCRAAIPTVEVP